jgi:serpin B
VPQNFSVALSGKPRVEAPVVSEDAVAELVGGNTSFALSLYRELADEDGNLFMSPYSISLALTMAFAGARGETRAEMAEALGFTLAEEELHAAFNALDQMLATRGADQPEDQKFTLEIANSMWAQQGFDLEEAFLDTLAENYGAGLRLVDYVRAAEAARLAINEWVEQNTAGRIKDLIPAGAVDDLTRLVLANAIYFKAAWAQEFDEELTADADFHMQDGGVTRVSMMNEQNYFNYGAGDGYQALEMPYVGNETSMVLLLPDPGRFTEFESTLDSTRLAEIISGMIRGYGTVSVPRFKFESSFSLPGELAALGMQKAFDPNSAEFSGISTAEQLYISDVVHKSFIAVDEQGTEAAAATGVIVGTTSMPVENFQFVADRPFLFLVRDIETGAVLFLGRLTQPD